MIAFLFAAASLAAAQPHPVVRTVSGPVRGLTMDDGSALFRAVPFAAPSVGELRWRPPGPVRPWTETRDAMRAAPACPQPDYGWNKGDIDHGTSEDCLYLEVRTPDLKPRKPLPVMVWVHGGNATAGRGSWPTQGTLHRHGVVLVTVQYRLGALGWMAHPALSAEQGGSSGNYGLMDVQAALRWVRSNIGRFGGDPGNVTLFGSSAGAQIGHLEMLSPGAEGLFHKAILQSGSSNFHYPTRSMREGEKQGRLIAAAAGLNADATVRELRSLPVERLLAAQESAPVPGQPDRYGIFLAPIVDGRALTGDPLAMRSSGRAASVPLLIGNNAQEEGIFGSDLDAASSAVQLYFGVNAARAIAFYGFSEPGASVTNARLGGAPMQAATDIIYRCVTAAISKSALRSGVPVWLYQYDYGVKVTHSSELGLLFGFESTGNPMRPPLAAYWANFARTGDPNGAGLPRWPRYLRGHRDYLEFSPTGPVAKSRLREPPCGWFQGPPRTFSRPLF